VRFLKKIAVCILFMSFSAVQSEELCPPAFQQPEFQSESKTQKQNGNENPVFVYFDGSLSMKGFVVDQPGQKNLYVSVIDDLQQIAENVGDKTYYHKFGNEVHAIKGTEAAKATKESFYECESSVAKCDNQHTAIQLPFKDAKANIDATYIIVTDLFLESKQLIGATRDALTKPLKSILKKGQSIGVIGVMSSFNGKIWGIPTSAGPTMSYSKSLKRPFYIIVIGNEKNINRIRKNLEEQHFIDPGDEYKFALITSSPVLKNLSEKKIITENSIPKLSNEESFSFQYHDDKLPVYSFYAEKKRKFKLKIKKSDYIVPGSTGLTNYRIEENLWWSQELKCRKITEDSWTKTKHETISTHSEKDNELNINLFKKLPLKEFFPAMRYFYVMHLYADEPGKVSEKIFKEWSIPDADAEKFTNENPAVFKTLNLTKIIAILNAVANDSFEPALIASLALDFRVKK